MTDETSLAFDLPIARAKATGSIDMLDRISVRDFVKDVEIGAFQSERGVTQRIRFNVVLEVGHSTAAQDDDVDKVISYDTIVEAIEDQLSTERINLLETLAERIAERCLADRRAVRVFVRIEKLDRIPGSLGVEIARARVELSDRVVQGVARDSDDAEDHAPHPLVIHLANAALGARNLGDWLDAIDGLVMPAVLALDAHDRLSADHPLVERRMHLLSIEQNAWMLAGRDPRCVVVATRTELVHAARTGQLSVWAPSKIVLDAVDKPAAATDPVALAAWFAGQIEARALLTIGAGSAVPGTDLPFAALDLDNPEALVSAVAGF